SAAPVTAERLHGGIVDHDDGTTECAREVEAHPPAAQMVWFGGDFSEEDDARITNRHDVIGPIPHRLLDVTYHVASGHRGSGRNSDRFPVPGRPEFDIRPAHVHDKDFEHRFSLAEWRTSRSLLRGVTSSSRTSRTGEP